MREVSAACDREGVAEADGGLMLAVVLGPPGEIINTMFPRVQTSNRTTPRVSRRVV